MGFSYVNETIMKVKAKEGSTHASFLSDGGMDTGSNGTEQLGATIVVEVGRELS